MPPALKSMYLYCRAGRLDYNKCIKKGVAFVGEFDYLARFDSSASDGVRWYDQKVTYENIAHVANAALSAVTVLNKAEFSRMDLMDVPSFEHVVTREYGKPSLKTDTTENEYDKFLLQPLCVLAYAGVLSTYKKRARMFKVRDMEVLQRIAGNENESRKFLIQYLEWVLKKFGWWHNFETYRASSHSKEDLEQLKSQFLTLGINTLNLGAKGSDKPGTEAGRIFQKVLNLLAFQYLVPGIEGGRVMEFPPSRFDLSYNRPNWRDVASNKPKSKSRKAYDLEREEALQGAASSNAKTVAMRKVRDYHGGVSEVPDASGIQAKHVHHIFPQSRFPQLRDVHENLIALTPGQHLGEAHPDGATHKIDPVFQRTCLAMKLESIRRSVEKQDGMYSYERFAQVLQEGLGITLPNPDYESIKAALVSYSA